MKQHEEIFHLYIQKLAGHLSDGEIAYVEEQLAGNGEFKAIWEQLEREEQTMNTRGFGNNINAVQALESVKKQLSPARKIFPVKKLLAAAAVLILIAAGGYMALMRPKQPAGNNTARLEKTRQSIRLQLANGESVALDSAGRTIALGNTTLNTQNGALGYTSTDTATNTLWVPAGENYRIVLSDGTEVWLNSATKLTFPFHFGKGGRNVYVEGEAYFKVAKNAAQPFVVHTPLTQVQVLGTSFNINTYGDAVKTALVEGSVITKSTDGQQMQLKPGFESSYSSGHGFAAGSFDEEEVLSWLNGIYYYHQVPLPELAAVASRFYGINIHLDKSKYNHVTVTGLMDRTRINEFLADLQTTARISYELGNNEVYLK